MTTSKWKCSRNKDKVLNKFSCLRHTDKSLGNGATSRKRNRGSEWLYSVFQFNLKLSIILKEYCGENRSTSDDVCKLNKIESKILVSNAKIMNKDLFN